MHVIDLMAMLMDSVIASETVIHVIEVMAMVVEVLDIVIGLKL